MVKKLIKLFGVLTVAAGIVMVFCATAFFLSSCTQGVNPEDGKDVAVTSITLNKSTVSLVSGESFQFEAKVLPENATNKEVTWSVSSTSNGTINSKGILKATNTGNSTASIKVTAKAADGSGKKATATVNIKVALPSEYKYSGFKFITAGPSYDCKNGMVISWHSETSENVLEYTEADGSEFVNSVNVTGAKSTSDWADKAVFFRCRKELTGLTSGSTYKYRVKAVVNGKETVSAVKTFKTAGDDTTFNFMVMSDLHTPKGSKSYISTINSAITYSNAALKAAGKDDVAFCLFNGDMVNKGQIYQQWDYWGNETSLGNMMYAFTVGNHDYYPYGEKSRITNSWYLDCVSIPKSGDSAADSSITTNLEPSNYWFNYNNVLFICLDTMMMEATKMSDTGYEKSFLKQVAWFKEVVNANLGKFDYLVVAKHYTFINANEISSYGDYNSWYPIFDQCGVDFAIGSDEHTYSRTKLLKEDKVQSDSTAASTTGTVYLTTPQTEGELSKFYNGNAGGRSAFNAGGGEVGGIYFTVTPEKMDMNLVGNGGTIYDTCSVYKRDRSSFGGFIK